jgi:hypothetical protein
MRAGTIGLVLRFHGGTHASLEARGGVYLCTDGDSLPVPPSFSAPLGKYR